MPGGNAAHPSARERGAGLLSMCFGLLFFLGFLFLATQVLVTLYARSAVSSAAYDAARILAVSQDGDGVVKAPLLPGAEEAARARVHHLLGRDATLRIVRFDTAESVVEVEVSKPKPRLLLNGGTLGGDTISTHALVRIEQLQ